MFTLADNCLLIVVVSDHHSNVFPWWADRYSSSELVNIITPCTVCITTIHVHCVKLRICNLYAVAIAIRRWAGPG